MAGLVLVVMVVTDAVVELDLLLLHLQNVPSAVITTVRGSADKHTLTNLELRSVNGNIPITGEDLCEEHVKTSLVRIVPLTQAELSWAKLS